MLVKTVRLRKTVEKKFIKIGIFKISPKILDRKIKISRENRAMLSIRDFSRKEKKIIVENLDFYSAVCYSEYV